MSANRQPLAFQPSYEVVEPDGAETFEGIRAAMRHIVEALGGSSPALKALGGHPNTHILGETFCTMVPLLHGRNFGNVSVAPVSPELTALTGKTVDVSGRPNALRDEVREFFARQGGTWEILDV